MDFGSYVRQLREQRREVNRSRTAPRSEPALFSPTDGPTDWRGTRLFEQDRAGRRIPTV